MAASCQDFSWPQVLKTTAPSSFHSVHLIKPTTSPPGLQEDPIILASSYDNALEYFQSQLSAFVQQRTEVLPICFWVVQTIAAQYQFNLGTAKPSAAQLLSPATAASTIQRCYCRHSRRVMLLKSTALASKLGIAWRFLALVLPLVSLQHQNVLFMYVSKKTNYSCGNCNPILAS